MGHGANGDSWVGVVSGLGHVVVILWGTEGHGACICSCVGVGWGLRCVGLGGQGPAVVVLWASMGRVGGVQ